MEGVRVGVEVGEGWVVQEADRRVGMGNDGYGRVDGWENLPIEAGVIC